MTEEAAPNVHLPSFTGPLDLLYYLIRKHELEISEISLASISDEFAAFIEASTEPNLGVAGGFLVIASTLMYLKSKWLIPSEQEAPGTGEEEEQAGALLQQLVQYEKLREIVQDLAHAEERSRAAFPRPLTEELAHRLDQMAEEEPFIEVSSFELLKALQRIQEFAFPPSREISREEINLEDKIEELLALVRVRTRVSLTQVLMASRSYLEAAVLFLAALELARQKALRLTQKESFGDITVVLREEPAGAASAGAVPA